MDYNFNSLLEVFNSLKRKKDLKKNQSLKIAEKIYSSLFLLLCLSCVSETKSKIKISDEDFLTISENLLLSSISANLVSDLLLSDLLYENQKKIEQDQKLKSIIQDLETFFEDIPSKDLDTQSTQIKNPFLKQIFQNFHQINVYCCNLSYNNPSSPCAFSNEAKNIAKLLEFVKRLCYLQRTGWINQKIPDPETVAAHMSGMSFLLILSTHLDKKINFDLVKCLKMVLVHDFSESIVGDITPVDKKVSYEEKQQLEIKAMQNLVEIATNALPEGDSHFKTQFTQNFFDLWSLFEADDKDKVIEAQICRGLDLMDMYITLINYEDPSFEINAFIPMGFLKCIDYFGIEIDTEKLGIDPKIFNKTWDDGIKFELMPSMKNMAGKVLELKKKNK